MERTFSVGIVLGISVTLLLVYTLYLSPLASILWSDTGGGSVDQDVSLPWFSGANNENGEIDYGSDENDICLSHEVLPHPDVIWTERYTVDEDVKNLSARIAPYANCSLLLHKSQFVCYDYSRRRALDLWNYELRYKTTNDLVFPERFPVGRFLDLVKDKHVHMIGDSILRNFYIDIALNLCIYFANEGQHLEQPRVVRCDKSECGFSIFIPSHEVHLNYKGSWHFKMHREGEWNEDFKNTLKLMDKIHILIISEHHHTRHLKDCNPGLNRTAWSTWFYHEVTKELTNAAQKHDRKPLIIWRGCDFRHYSSGDWNTGGTCGNRPGSKWQEVEHDEMKTILVRNGHIRSSVEHFGQLGHNVRMLDTSYITWLRGDGHCGSNIKMDVYDCVHYCIPGVPDFWAYSFFDLLQKFYVE